MPGLIGFYKEVEMTEKIKNDKSLLQSDSKTNGEDEGYDSEDWEESLKNALWDQTEYPYNTTTTKDKDGEWERIIN